MKTRTLIALLAILLTASLCVWVVTYYVSPPVTASLRVVPKSYDGDCPVTVQFFGTVTARKPGKVYYHFLRSDGAAAPLKTLHFTEPGTKAVSENWTLTRTSYEGWQAIEVVHPQAVKSNSVTFKIQCRSQVADRFRFVVFGDSQDEGGDFAWLTDSRGVNGDVFVPMLAEVMKLNPTPALAVFLGDMSVSSGFDEWRDWDGYLKPLRSRGISIYNVVGNHELGDPDNPELEWQQRYQKFFSHLPSNGPPQYEHLAYSFEYGNSLFTILDSFYIYPRTGHAYREQVSSEQRGWLARRTAETRSSHKFAFTHAPALPVTRASGDVMLWRSLVASDFDALFSGHEHLYARWVKGETGYPLQITSGGAGGELSRKILNLPTYPDSGKAYTRGHHFVVVDVTGRTVLITAIGIERGIARPVDYHIFNKRMSP